MIIRIGSHRAWHRVKRVLGVTPKGLFSLKYPGSHGFCDVQEDDWERIKTIPSVRKSRVKRDELMECWSSEVTL